MTERLNERREEQAQVELGTTGVTPAVARALVGAFLATILAVPLLQSLSAPPPFSNLVAELPTPCTLERFERDLEDASVVGQKLQPHWQALAIEALGLGNEQVYPGRSGWLFHRPGVDYVAGRGFLDPNLLHARSLGGDSCDSAPHPDPRVAIVDFARELRERDIELVVLPTPVKAVVAPDRFVRGAAAPHQNPSWPEFAAALEADGVAVFDPTALLGPGDFLATDTHWRPEAAERVAAALATDLESSGRLRPRDGSAFERTREFAANRGDLRSMLDLPAGSALYPAERVEIAPVRRRDGTPLGAGAEVLLLGDSFSNIYSSREAFAQTTPDGEQLDWGEAAGLAEQLAFELGRPVDRIVRNAGGAYATRVALAAEIAREASAGRDRLAGVKVVVYQFAMRELAQGDWRPVTLGAAPEFSDAPSPEVLAGPSARRITGTLRARGTLPRPGTVPYPEALVALHLDDVDGSGDIPAVVVYVWGMREHTWTDAARWPIGTRLTFDVRSWEDAQAESRLETVSRGELDDLELLALPAYFGEVVR